MPLASVYLLAQAVLAVGWWALLALSPADRLWFRPSSGTDDMLLAFWLADLLCIAGGSLLAAWWLRVGHRRRVHALWFLSGAIAYATLYCLALVAMTGEAWLGAILMVPAASVTVWITWRATSR
jgi:hypothetical protein